MVVVGWLAAGAGVLKVSQVQKFLLSLSLLLSLDSRFQLSKISLAFAYIHACVVECMGPRNWWIEIRATYVM